MQDMVNPYFFNTANNLEYVDPYPQPHYYGVDYMSGDERTQFFNCTRSKKTTFLQ